MTDPHGSPGRDVMIYREQSSEQVFVVHGGAKFPLPDDDDPGAYDDRATVRAVVDGALRQFPARPRDGTVLRERHSNTCYVVFGGARFLVPDMAALARLYGGERAVRVVPRGSFQEAGIGLVPADGTMLREEGTTAPTVIRGGVRCRPRPDDLAHANCVGVVPEGSLRRFPRRVLGGPPRRPPEPAARAVWGTRMRTLLRWVAPGGRG